MCMSCNSLSQSIVKNIAPYNPYLFLILHISFLSDIVNVYHNLTLECYTMAEIKTRNAVNMDMSLSYFDNFSENQNFALQTMM